VQARVGRGKGIDVFCRASPSLTTHSPTFSAFSFCTTRDPYQSFYCISHSLAADLTRRIFYLTFCSLTPVSFRTPTTCLTAADTAAVAMAAAAVDAAATGTKTAQQEADRTTITTTRANIYRTGRTIHPHNTGEASVAWFLTAPILRYFFSHHLLCADQVRRPRLLRLPL
jgi:hypothetical protein